MATTTTAFTACDYVLNLDDSVGTPQDISGSSSNVDVNFDNKIGEFRTFGTEWMQRMQCGKDASFKIKGIATQGANEIKDLIETWYFDDLPGPRTFSLAQPSNDAGVGNYIYSAEVFLKSYKFSGDATSADPVMYDIELVPTGQVTRTLIP